MGFIITSATKEHIDGFANVMVKSWHAAYCGIVPQEYLTEYVTMEKYQPRVQNILSGSLHYNYVALLDKQVIGVFTISKLRDEGATECDGELIAIYLLPEYCGKGYGKQLMNYAIAKLREMGFANMYLWVLAENVHAQRFYEKCGFAFDGTKKETTIGKPLYELRYQKSLAPAFSSK